ncbi:MAG TPA: hypothetical protein VNZ45_18045 [Bacteroidia bacterium]|jgi:hypothetical protein|nr:hypothetical protein [Bacteroidia bacterium]
MITSPTTYDTFGTPSWVNTNIYNDHYTPLRQDYQLTLPFYLNGGTAGNPGPISEGLYLNIAREKTYRYPMRSFGRYMQVTITNTSGTIAIRNISINDTESQRATRAT